ncbi:MAG: dienelactone hydrolase family protein [Bacteroidales bacterium]
MIAASLFFVILVSSSFNVIRKRTVTFTSEDGLQITADEYIIAADLPYIVLFHEQESSRGEFDLIARRLCKMDYNCLAVDLRNGGGQNFVSNETAKRCRAAECLITTERIQSDMKAAIDYALGQTHLPVVLFGSSANGSLSLKMALENENVRAVVALSPGEYFLPGLSIQETIAGLKKPAFVTSSRSEFGYVETLASGVERQYMTLFEPQLGEGDRGSHALADATGNSSEYWLALLLFFKELV